MIMVTVVMILMMTKAMSCRIQLVLVAFDGDECCDFNEFRSLSARSFVLVKFVGDGDGDVQIFLDHPSIPSCPPLETTF